MPPVQPLLDEAGLPRPQPSPAAPAPARRAARFPLLARLANWVVTLVLAIAIAGIAVVNVGPLFLPYRMYTVLSGSMSPTIPVGSEVVLRPVAAGQIRPGDIITFTPPGHADKLVTHRVIALGTDAQGVPFWRTQGDANSVPDAWLIPATGTGYRYWFQIPLLGYLLVMLASPIGRICFIVAPALLLAAVVVNDMMSPRRQAQATTEPGRNRG